MPLLSLLAIAAAPPASQTLLATPAEPCECKVPPSPPPGTVVPNGLENDSSNGPMLGTLQLFTRALSDAPCKASRYNSVAIYPFTETEYAELRLESQASRVAPDRALPVSDSDNAHSVAAGVAEAKKSLPKAKVFVTDVDNSGLDQPLPHFSGTKVLLEDLKSLDVGDIEMLAFDEREINTLNEAETVVRWSLAHKVEALVIVAPPFHLPRALLTTLSVVKRMRGSGKVFMPLHVYTVSGGRSTATWWGEVAPHSQGLVTGTRTELLGGELERILAYSAKGDLLSPAEAVQILEERDRNVNATAAGTTAVGNPVHVDFAEFDFDPSPSTRR